MVKMTPVNDSFCRSKNNINNTQTTDETMIITSIRCAKDTEKGRRREKGGRDRLNDTIKMTPNAISMCHAKHGCTYVCSHTQSAIIL